MKQQIVNIQYGNSTEFSEMWFSMKEKGSWLDMGEVYMKKGNSEQKKEKILTEKGKYG